MYEVTSTRYGVISSEVRKWPTRAKASDIVVQDRPFWEGFDHGCKGRSMPSCFYCACCLCRLTLSTQTLFTNRHELPRHTPWSYVYLFSGNWSGSSPAAHRALARDEGDGFVGRSSIRSNCPKDQISNPLPTSISWGLEDTPPLPAPTGRRSGGHPYQGHQISWRKKGWGQVMVFAVNAVLIRFSTRSWLALTHQ